MCARKIFRMDQQEFSCASLTAMLQLR